MTRIRISAFVLSFFAAASVSFASGMEFSGDPPDPALVPMVGTAWFVYGQGNVEPDSGAKLERFINANRIPDESYIYLDSPGGNLVGGMELGKIIRKYSLRTNVGVKQRSTPAARQSGPGLCYSACALAFLGGEFRYLREGSRYGVHRFASANPSFDRSDVAQVVSAMIVEYVKSMDVDARFLSLMVSAGADTIYEPTRAELVAFGVVNDGRMPPKWSIESSGLGLYLKGEQNTANGMNKFILMCGSQRIVLYVIFDARRRENDILRFTADSLMTDGRRTRIDGIRLSRESDNGWINATYNITGHHLALIRSATTVGVVMQPTFDSPIFHGFDKMPFADGATKLTGFMNTCRS